MQQFVTVLQNRASSVEPNQVRSIILKYSLLTATKDEQQKLYSGQLEQHRDLRQALHLTELVLNTLRGTTSQQIDNLREWLMYRRVRILVQFDPKTVEAAVQSLEREYPHSNLLDDAYVEWLYTQAFMLRATPAVVGATFHLIAERFPKANAIDNAYNWYAVYLQCMKDYQAARSINLEIIRRFPMTRHAIYATARLAKPQGCKMWYD
jgi:hypothetical protein